jgi:Na+-driven multidrug efflux pump
LGAKQPERAEAAVWRTGLYNMLFLGGVGVFFILFAEPVIRLFTHDPAVVPLGVSCLRIVSYGNIGYAYAMVMLQAFNGAGDTVTPTFVNFLASGCSKSLWHIGWLFLFTCVRTERFSRS